MERENALINFRIQWAIILSGGVLATEGILSSAIKDAWAGGSSTSGPQIIAGAAAVGLMCFLSIIAFQFSQKSGRGVDAAQNQLSYLKDHYLSFNNDLGNLFENTFHLPRPFGDSKDHSSGNEAAIAFPKTLVWIWSSLAVIQFVFLVWFLSLLLLKSYPDVLRQTSGTVSSQISNDGATTPPQGGNAR